MAVKRKIKSFFQEKLPNEIDIAGYCKKCWNDFRFKYLFECSMYMILITILFQNNLTPLRLQKTIPVFQ